MSSGTVYVACVQVDSSPDGTPVHRYRLCDLAPRGSGQSEVELLDLGRDFAVPILQWPEFAVVVEILLTGLELTYEPDEDLLKAANDAANQLRQAEEPATEGAHESDPDEVEASGLDGFRIYDYRTIGGERLLLSALDDLWFTSILTATGLSRQAAAWAVAFVAAQMLQSPYDQDTDYWLSHSSGILELLDLHDLERHSNPLETRLEYHLWKRSVAIKGALAARERDLHGGRLQPAGSSPWSGVIFFLDCRPDFDPGTRARHSSRNRHVTLGITSDHTGTPRHIETVDEDLSAPASLASAVRRMTVSVQQEPGRPWIAMDSALGSDDSLAALAEQGYTWITTDRVPPCEDLKSPPDCEVVRESSGLEAKAWEAEESRSLGRPVRISGRAPQATELLEARASFEQSLQALHDGISLKGRLKNRRLVFERAMRLRDRHWSVCSEYDITVSPAPKGSRAAKNLHAGAVRWKRDWTGDDRIGTCLFRTNRATWNLEGIVRAWWRMGEITTPFRHVALGGDADTVQTHLSPAPSSPPLWKVLGDFAVRLLRHRLAQNGDRSNWATIRRTMRGQYRKTTQVPTIDGHFVRWREDEPANPAERQIALAAGVNPGRNLKWL